MLDLVNLLQYKKTNNSYKANNMVDKNKNSVSKDINIRCPKLGHQINFFYCKQENNGLPCFKTLDCWYNYFDVKTYLTDILTKKDFDLIFSNKPKEKIHSLLALIEQAKQRRIKK